MSNAWQKFPGLRYEGLEKIIVHVEKYWRPTMTSTGLTGKLVFRFKADKTGEKVKSI